MTGWIPLFAHLLFIPLVLIGWEMRNQHDETVLTTALTSTTGGTGTATFKTSTEDGTTLWVVNLHDRTTGQYYYVQPVWKNASGPCVMAP